MTIWNDDIALTCHMLYRHDLKVSAETVPTPEGEPRDWEEGEVVQEGDIIIKVGFKGYQAHEVVAGTGKASTGMASRNYHPATGGDWKLGHRD